MKLLIQVLYINVVRVGFTNWICVTFFTFMVELISYQLKSNKEITQSQDNLKYKLLKIIGVLFVGYFFFVV